MSLVKGEQAREGSGQGGVVKVRWSEKCSDLHPPHDAEECCSEGRSSALR